MNYEPIRNFENYAISENGKIIEMSTNTKIKKFRAERHHVYKTILEKDNEEYKIILARIVYETYYNDILKDSDYIIYNDKNHNNLHYTNLIKQSPSFINKEVKIELDKNKIWKSKENFSHYKISNYGDVYSIKMNIILKAYTLHHKNSVVNLVNDDGDAFLVYINRLVFDVFKGFTKENALIIHIDKNYENNFIENLKECDNNDYANRKGYIRSTYKINQYTLDGQFIKLWESFAEITAVLGYNERGIHHCCYGHNKTSHGFIWKYDSKIDDISEYCTILNNNGHTYNNYKINKKGDIINKLNMLKTLALNRGYYSVSLISDSGVKKSFSVHRLVAFTFIKNEFNYPYINHIDENKLNDDVENLEWCTARYNSVYSLGKKVYQYDLKGNLIHVFPSIVDATNSNEIFKRPSIGKACNGNQLKAYGYIWKFHELIPDLPKPIDLLHIDTQDYYFYITIEAKNIDDIKKLKYIFTYLMCGEKGKILYPEEDMHSKAKLYQVSAALYTIKNESTTPMLYGLLRYVYRPHRMMTIKKLENIGKNVIVNVKKYVSTKEHKLTIESINSLLEIITDTSSFGSSIADFY